MNVARRVAGALARMAWCAFVAGVAAWPALAASPVVTVSHGAAAAPELAAYRAWARGDSAAAALLDVARFSILNTLPHEEWPRPDDGATPPSEAPAEPAWPGAPRPVYVTLTRGRAVRACVGSDVPLEGSLGGTVWRLARQALTADRRRAPVREDEFDSLHVVIAFAGDPVPVADPYAVRPLQEGLRIETPRGGIVFLPGEARTISWAIAEARRAGVLSGPLSEARCSRFPVVVVRDVHALNTYQRLEGAVP